MTTNEAIAVVESMGILDRASLYLKYLINSIYSKYAKGHDGRIYSFDEFFASSNIHINDTGVDDWKERGYASKSWVVFNPNSAYFYVYHDIN